MIVLAIEQRDFLLVGSPFCPLWGTTVNIRNRVWSECPYGWHGRLGFSLLLAGVSRERWAWDQRDRGLRGSATGIRGRHARSASSLGRGTSVPVVVLLLFLLPCGAEGVGGCVCVRVQWVNYGCD
jgi:hypothetical protein